MIPTLNVQYARAHNYIVKTILCKLTKRITVLDVGCGEGNIILNIADSLKGLNSRSLLIGLDINKKSLKTLKATSKKIGFKNISLIQCSAEKLPLRYSSINLLVCTHVLEHIQNDKTAFSETNKVLSKEGFYWFASPRPLRCVSPIHMPLMLFMGRGVGHVRSGYKLNDRVRFFRKNGFYILATFDNSDIIHFFLQYPSVLLTTVHRLIQNNGCEVENLCQVKKLASKLDNHLPSLSIFGSGYTIIAKKCVEH